MCKMCCISTNRIRLSVCSLVDYIYEQEARPAMEQE